MVCVPTQAPASSQRGRRRFPALRLVSSGFPWRQRKARLTSSLVGLSALVAFLGLTGLSGCSSITVLRTKELRAVQDSVSTVRQEIAQLQKAVDDLNLSQGGLTSKMRADMTAMLEELRGQISRLHSEIDETQHRLGQLSQKLDKLDARKVVGGPVGDSVSGDSGGMKIVDGLDLQNLFNQAREDHISGKYELAYQGFKTVYEKDQGGSFKELSLFWMAECLSKGGKNARAIELYEKLLVDFPQGLKRCSAMFKLGMIHDENKDISARNEIFEKLKKECPSSNEAGRAADILSR